MKKSFFYQLKLMFSIAIIATASISFVFCIILSYNTMQKDFNMKVSTENRQLIELINFNMGLIEESSNYLVKNNQIISALKSDIYDQNIVSILNGIRSIDYSIMGVSLYSANNIIYFSDSINSPCDFQYIKEKGFMNNNSITWYARFDLGNQYYADGPHNIFTCVNTIYDESDMPIGCLLIDVPLKNIENIINSENNTYKQRVIFEDTNGNIMSFKNADTPEERTAYKQNYAKNHKCTSTKIRNSDLIINIYASPQNLYKKLLALIEIFIVFFMVLTCISYLTIRGLTKSISVPMESMAQNIYNYAQQKTFSEDCDYDYKQK